ncbi:MAG: cytochrome c assembly protein [Saprospirales bacterium]|nr:MAG: cytochrome c assembly protein [Saprospirales bacterium]
MNEIQYIGETLWPGRLGHFLIITGFVAALGSTVAYYLAEKERDKTNSNWLNTANWTFTIHGISIIGLMGIIFYVMLNRMYEYAYAFNHVSDDLPFKYMFSAFWEGQEGSFLLWIFWHIILGWILIWKAGEWKPAVMTFLSLIQVWLTSMILGTYLPFGNGESRIGINPTVLLREVQDAPIFANAEYLELISGSGLNILLQNYWMTIHPPTTFLGFAACAIPFCYALAALWRQDYRGWLKPGLKWGLFASFTLGTGILMGSAWAYEALTFGGYWAWDPVENMSLVPWLIMVAGVHTNLIARSTGHSIRATMIFYILTFCLVVYSTYLVRSGILEDTSVHAFTEMGLENQLVFFILFFLILGLVMFFRRYNSIPTPQKEEDWNSREFWMFVGAMVIVIGSALITWSTSLPVTNAIMQFFDPFYASRVIEDPISHYNRHQLWVGMLMAFLTGISIYMRYRGANWEHYKKKFFSQTGVALLLTAVLTWATIQWIQVVAWQYILLIFAALFAFIVNLDHVLFRIKGNLKASGSAMAHIGFAMMIIGIMASGINKTYISSNVFAQSGLLEGMEDEDLLSNIVLIKGEPIFMRGYIATYVGDRFDGPERSFDIEFTRIDEDGREVETFMLSPNVIYDKQFTKIEAANPDIRRQPVIDIFTRIARLPAQQIDLESAREVEDSLKFETYYMSLGDTTFTSKHFVVLEEIHHSILHPEREQGSQEDLALSLKLKVHSLDSDSAYTIVPGISLRGSFVFRYPEQIDPFNLRVQLSDTLIEDLFHSEIALDYSTFLVERGETFEFGGYDIKFVDVNQDPWHPSYEPQTDDIALSAILEVTNRLSSAQYRTEPLYLIRDTRQTNYKTMIPEAGLHFRFTRIDPNTGQMTFKVAEQPMKVENLPVQIAENVPRTDFIVLEAIRFEGLNFFWVGSSLMMLGLLFAMIVRIRSKM